MEILYHFLSVHYPVIHHNNVAFDRFGEKNSTTMGEVNYFFTYKLYGTVFHLLIVKKAR